MYLGEFYNAINKKYFEILKKYNNIYKINQKYCKTYKLTQNTTTYSKT